MMTTDYTGTTLPAVPTWLADFIQELKLGFNINSGPFLAGGAVRRTMKWYLENYPVPVASAPIPPDFDIFCKNAKQHEDVCQYLLDVGAELQTTNERHHNFTIEEKGWKIQVVKQRFYYDAVSLLDSFDFRICRFAADSSGFIIFDKLALEDLKTNRLVTVNIENPISSFVRLIKYSKQGFQMSGEDLVEFMHQCQIRLDKLSPVDWESYIHTTLGAP